MLEEAKDPAQKTVPSSPAGSSLSAARSSLSSGLQLHIELQRRPVWVIVIGDPETNVTLSPRPGVLFLARAKVSPLRSASNSCSSFFTESCRTFHSNWSASPDSFFSWSAESVRKVALLRLKSDRMCHYVFWNISDLLYNQLNYIFEGSLITVNTKADTWANTFLAAVKNYISKHNWKMILSTK